MQKCRICLSLYLQCDIQTARHESRPGFRLILHLSYGKFFSSIDYRGNKFFGGSRNASSDGQSARFGKTCRATREISGLPVMIFIRFEADNFSRKLSFLILFLPTMGFRRGEQERAFAPPPQNQQKFKNLLSL